MPAAQRALPGEQTCPVCEVGRLGEVPVVIPSDVPDT